MRGKTPAEIRAEIKRATHLRQQSQVMLASSVGIDQATVSRILNGRFVRVSPAVRKLCEYARIKYITPKPLSALDASILQLSKAVRRGSPQQRRVLRLLRLAKELSDSEMT